MKFITIYHVSMNTDIDKFDYLSILPYNILAGYPTPKVTPIKITHFSEIFERDLDLSTFEGMLDFMIDFVKLFNKNGFPL